MNILGTVWTLYLRGFFGYWFAISCAFIVPCALFGHSRSNKKPPHQERLVGLISLSYWFCRSRKSSHEEGVWSAVSLLGNLIGTIILSPSLKDHCTCHVLPSVVSNKMKLYMLVVGNKTNLPSLLSDDNLSVDNGNTARPSFSVLQ